MRALSPEERTRIEAAVAAAETHTSAEFALVVAQASDHYAAFPLLWSAVLALAAGGAIAITLPSTSGAVIFAIQATLFVAACLILHARPLGFRMVPAAVRQEHARRLARLQFASLVQERTHGDVGLLLFVSLAERHVEILVDRGIADRISETAWQKIIDDFVAAVRAGRVTEGLIAAVAGCATVLETYFPAAPGNHNEIPDRVTEI
ncbi:MAG: TPM domain-containing protein [Rhodospirillaceae bacterium]|nr:TPM domain-containing protein [Rhodospirillaceae bacterium]